MTKINSQGTFSNKSERENLEINFPQERTTQKDKQHNKAHDGNLYFLH